MSNSDIMEIILQKKKELKLYIKTPLNWWELEREEFIKHTNTAIHRLDFELRQRDPDTKTKNTREELEQKKKTTSISELIQSIT